MTKAKRQDLTPLEGEGWRDWRAEMGRRQYYSGGRRGRGKKAGASAPDRGAVAYLEQRGHGDDAGEERAVGARQRGEGCSRAGEGLCSVLKVYTHTHIHIYTHSHTTRVLEYIYTKI